MVAYLASLQPIAGIGPYGSLLAHSMPKKTGNPPQKELILRGAAEFSEKIGHGTAHFGVKGGAERGGQGGERGVQSRDWVEPTKCTLSPNIIHTP